MADFKVTISDPETGESRSVEIEGNRAVPLIGRRLSDVIDGEAQRPRWSAHPSNTPRRFWVQS